MISVQRYCLFGGGGKKSYASGYLKDYKKEKKAKTKIKLRTQNYTNFLKGRKILDIQSINTY